MRHDRGKRPAGLTLCAITALSVSLLISACSVSPLARGPIVPSSQPRPGAPEIGIASWYGPGFHGRRTSSGEVYNQNDLTAAHPNLPLGTAVMVTNLENGRSVEVRINDRGPFAGNRVIDLSEKAARQLEMIGPGTAEVSVELIPPRESAAGTVHFAVQAGSFADGSRASELRDQLAAIDREAYLSLFRTDRGLFYRVRLGPYPNRGKASAEAQSLARHGLAALVVEEIVP